MSDVESAAQAAYPGRSLFRAAYRDGWVARDAEFAALSVEVAELREANERISAMRRQENERWLRNNETQRAFLERVAASHGIRSDEVTDGFLDRAAEALLAESEWDWSYSRSGYVQNSAGMTEKEARWYAENLEPAGVYSVVRRRKAGPWVPADTPKEEQ